MKNYRNTILVPFGSALLGGALAIGGFLFFQPQRPAPEPGERSALATPEDLQHHFSATINQAMPSVVIITASQRRPVRRTPYANLFNYNRRQPVEIDYQDIPSGQGSGFFVREDGHILTNYHIVRNQDSFRVSTYDGREYDAEVVGIDPPSDLAILKIADGKPFPVLKFADISNLDIGHWAIAIGAPFSLNSTVTVGVVSNKHRSGVGINLHESYIQTDASINPGNSGGPLLNADGEVIGVNDFILSPSGGNIGLSFAISADLARQVTEDLITHGQVNRPWLGIVMQDSSDNNGVRVQQIFRDSPAAEKLRPGDLIPRFNDQPVTTPQELQSLIYSARPGDQSTLTLVRDGIQLQYDLLLQSPPQAWYQRRGITNGFSLVENL